MTRFDNNAEGVRDQAVVRWTFKWAGAWINRNINVNWSWASQQRLLFLSIYLLIDSHSLHSTSSDLFKCLTEIKFYNIHIYHELHSKQTTSLWDAGMKRVRFLPRTQASNTWHVRHCRQLHLVFIISYIRHRGLIWGKTYDNCGWVVLMFRSLILLYQTLPSPYGQLIGWQQSIAHVALNIMLRFNVVWQWIPAHLPACRSTKWLASVMLIIAHASPQSMLEPENKVRDNRDNSLRISPSCIMSHYTRD